MVCIQQDGYREFGDTGEVVMMIIVLECLEDFSAVCCEEEERFGSIDEVLR